MMVAAWTLVPPFAITARARRACRDDDGRFVLRSVPPGLQEPSAADVPAGSASHLAQRGEAGGETNAVRRHTARPRGTRRGADSGLAPRNRSASESRFGRDKPPSVERHPNRPRPARGSVERSGIARWSRHYSPEPSQDRRQEPVITALLFALESLHDRSWHRQRDPLPHHSGGRPGPESATVSKSLVPRARGALWLSVMTTW